jgi:hypothetical protein
VAALNVPETIAQLDKLERILHAPGQTRPPFALIYPILAFCCGPDVDPALRQAGFISLVAYLETPADESSDLEQGPLFWHFIRSANRNHLASDDWDQRLKALQVLVSGGGRVEGLVDLIPTLCTWQVYTLEATTLIGGLDSGSLSDAFNERIVLQRRGADIQRLILQICNKNVLTLTERDEECAIVAFLKALEVAVQESYHVEPSGRSEPSNPNRRSRWPSCTCLSVVEKRADAALQVHLFNEALREHQTSTSHLFNALFPGTSAALRRSL